MNKKQYSHIQSLNQYKHPTISVHSSDASSGNLKHNQIKQSLDVEKKKKKAQLKNLKKSSSSGGLTIDYTKIWDVLCLLTQEVCFYREDINEEIDVEYLTVWGRLFQTVAAWNEKDLCPFVLNEWILNSLVSEAEQSVGAADTT